MPRTMDPSYRWSIGRRRIIVMRIEVRLFGPQARTLGQSVAQVDVDGAAPTCGHLRAALAENFPQLSGELAACRFAINHEFANDQAALAPDDEVALIGPVSGG